MQALVIATALLALLWYRSPLANDKAAYYSILAGLALLLAGAVYPLMTVRFSGVSDHAVISACYALGVFLIALGFWRLRDKFTPLFAVSDPNSFGPDHHLDIAFDLVDQGFVVWSEQFSLLAFNRKYQEFMKYPAEFLKPGTPLLDCIKYQSGLGTYGPGEPDEIAQIRCQRIITERNTSEEIITTVSGLQLMVRRYYIPGYGHIATHTDITPLKSRELELANINAEKDKLFSIIAHDLKGPFVSIVGVTGMLTDANAKLSEDEVHALHASLHETGINVVKLLENLQEWSKFQRDAATIDPQVLQIGPIIHTSVDLYTPMAREKRLVFAVEEIPATPVLTDRHMVHTVLRNLIHNAVKFSHPDGQISIDVNVDKEWMWVSISDTGTGISAEKSQRIFDIDELPSMPGTQGELGSGLGLHLCQAFVHKCGGSIRVESVAGEGSKFRFSIPLA